LPEKTKQIFLLLCLLLFGFFGNKPHKRFTTLPGKNQTIVPDVVFAFVWFF